MLSEEEDPDMLLPGVLAAERVEVSRQLLNYWRQSGKLRPVEYRDGRPLYRLRDVLEVEAATLRSSQSRRARRQPIAA